MRGRERLGAGSAGLRPARHFYSLICLENRTFNSVGIPGPAAATSYLLEDTDNPTGCAWRGGDRRIALMALAIQYRPVPAMAAPSASPKTSVQNHQRQRYLPEVSVLGELQFLFKLLPQNLICSGCDSGRFRALSSVSTAAVANDTRSLFLNFPPLSPTLKKAVIPSSLPLAQPSFAAFLSLRGTGVSTAMEVCALF